MRRLRYMTDERGGTLVLVTFFLALVMIPLFSFAVDFGNFFLHKRHLQNQVDAAALAGGLSWSFPCTGATDTGIEDTARDYALNRNPQLETSASGTAFVRLNSTGYDAADFSDGGHPCSTGFLDVKGTDASVDWFFGLLSPVDVHAEARVAIQQATALGGLRPIGVRDVDVKTAAVIFIDDAAPDTPLAVKALTKTGTSGGMTNWSNAGDKASVIVAPRTSAIIMLSSRSSGVTLTGTTTAICNQAQVDCYYDSGGATFTPLTGLAFVRGFPGSPPSCCATVNPQARAVRFVSGGTCPDPYFFYRPTGGCTVRLHATMDFGSIPIGNIAMRAYEASTNSCQNNGSTLIPAPASGTSEWEVTLSAIAVDAGPVPISLCAEVSAGGSGIVVNGVTCRNGSNSCKYTFDHVHQAFSANDDISGPIRAVTIWNGDTSGSDCSWQTCTAPTYANAFVTGSTHLLYTVVQVAGALSTSASDPMVALRVAKDTSAGGTGNQTAIDCEQGINMRDELATGCSPTYQINTRMGQANPCNPPYGTGSNGLWASPQPWQCVAVKPGGTIGQFTDGISLRIFGNANPPNTCPAAGQRGANNWSTSFGTNFDGDYRLIQLFMVPFGSFRDTGADQIYPVVNFGAFYVRDFGGNGNNDDPCGEYPGDPLKGYLYGNFVKYIVPSGAGSGGGAPCDPSAFSPCIPVLVK